MSNQLSLAGKSAASSASSTKTKTGLHRPNQLRPSTRPQKLNSAPEHVPSSNSNSSSSSSSNTTTKTKPVVDPHSKPMIAVTSPPKPLPKPHVQVHVPDNDDVEPVLPVPTGSHSAPNSRPKFGQVHQLLGSNPNSAASTPTDSVPKELWDIPFSELVLQEQIGCGGFGEVFKGSWAHTTVAVKKVWDSTTDWDEMVKAFKQEVGVLTALRHPNIVLFMGACTTPPNLCMVMEYVSGGNLRKLLNECSEEKTSIRLADRVRMCIETARALVYLHKKTIVHRDLKSFNLLIDTDLHIKLCDFGLARVTNKRKTVSMRGTSEWMAPEVIRGQKYDALSDVYSFGIIMCEVLTNMNTDDIPKGGFMQLEVKLDELREKLLNQYEVNHQLVDIIISCLNSDNQARPAMEVILAKLDTIMREMFPIAAIKSRNRLPFLQQIEKEGDSVLRHESFARSAQKIELGDSEAEFHWTTTAGSAIQCSWDTFSKSIAHMCSNNAGPLRPLLTDGVNPEQVTKRTFKVFLDMFGAFSTSFRKASECATKPYFHGYMHSIEADDRLKGQPVGTFLVRVNPEKSGTFAVSYIKEGLEHVAHTLVEVKKDQGYSADGLTFYPTMEDFVSAHGKRLTSPFVGAPAHKKTSFQSL